MAGVASTKRLRPFALRPSPLSLSLSKAMPGGAGRPLGANIANRRSDEEEFASREAAKTQRNPLYGEATLSSPTTPLARKSRPSASRNFFAPSRLRVNPIIGRRQRRCTAFDKVRLTGCGGWLLGWVSGLSGLQRKTPTATPSPIPLAPLSLSLSKAPAQRRGWGPGDASAAFRPSTSSG